MFSKITRHAVCSLVLMGFMVVGASADMPTDRDVVYKIHDDPNDPNSDVVFSIWLQLTATARDGDSVGWEIEEIQFREVVDGETDPVWKKSSPTIPTPDGRWWIDHADGGSPQLAEFVDPPKLTGIAQAKDPSDDDLEYYFGGSTYSGSPPWEATVGLDHEFALVGAPDSFASEDDDPVEIDDEDRPDV